MKDLMTRGEFADFLGINFSTICHWQNRGLINYTQKTETGRYFFSPELKDFYFGDNDFPYTNEYHIKNTFKERIKSINGSKDHYVSDRGNIYLHLSSDVYLRKSQKEIYGYPYCGIMYDTNNGRKSVTSRVHRLVAEYFCDKKEGCDIVGHKDNVKNNNYYKNLYWTTNQENSQKAHDDGLVINDIGIEDSQSNPVAIFKNSGEIVGVYGSISEASRCINGFSKSSIHKNLDKVKKGTKGYYFESITKKFYLNNEKLQQTKLSVEVIKKRRRSFNVYDLEMNFLEESDNQKQTALRYNVHQASISRVLNTKNHSGIVQNKIIVKLKEE